MLFRSALILTGIFSIIPLIWFLIRFRGQAGQEPVTAALRWLVSVPVVLITRSIVLNLASLHDPLTSTLAEQVWSFSSFVYVGLGSWMFLNVWLKRRGKPIEYNRRKDDPKQEEPWN